MLHFSNSAKEGRKRFREAKCVFRGKQGQGLGGCHAHLHLRSLALLSGRSMGVLDGSCEALVGASSRVRPLFFEMQNSVFVFTSPRRIPASALITSDSVQRRSQGIF